MSNNSLVAKIQANADEQAAEIAKTAETEVSAIKKETEAKLQAMRDAHAVELKKRNKHLELVLLSQAKQSGKIALQQTKRDQIDAIFTETIKELITQPAESYVSYFAKQVKEVVPSSVTVTKVWSPAKRLAETKQILNHAGIADGVEEADVRLDAGLVVETTNGVYDITLQRLIDTKRAEIEMEIVNEVMS